MGEEFKRTYEILGLTPAHGNIILYDDIEGYFAWIGSGDGTPTIAKQDFAAYQGGFGLHILTDVTYMNASVTARAIRKVAIPKSLRFELALYARVNLFANTRYIKFALRYDNTFDKFTAAIRWRSVNDDIQYQNINGDWITLGTGLLGDFGNDQWFQVRLQANFTQASEQYIACQVGNYSYALPGIWLYPDTTDNAFELDVVCEITSAIGYARGLSIDDVMVQTT